MHIIQDVARKSEGNHALSLSFRAVKQTKCQACQWIAEELAKQVKRLLKWFELQWVQWIENLSNNTTSIWIAQTHPATPMSKLTKQAFKNKGMLHPHVNKPTSALQWAFKQQ